MTSKNIINQVQSVLQNDAALSAYVKKVYQGVRKDVGDVNFPCIIVEPMINEESDELDSHVLQRLHFKILISAYVRCFNMDLQIVGDSTHKGIMDVETDIKKALSAYYPTLNSTCIDFKFKQSSYEIEQWPIRGVSIEVDFYYQQNILTRT